jgi:hypothetical protein
VKGYVFSLAKADPTTVMARGLHGVWQPPPRDRAGAARAWWVPKWSFAMLATFADYSTMRPGDLVFFFSNRLIYGIGRIVDPLGVGRGAFLNFEDAFMAHPPDPDPDQALIGPAASDEWRRLRVIVPFVPAPAFFKKGLDMDEVLAGPGAEASWGLRFWQGYSFAQLGDQETSNLLDAFLRRFGNLPGGPEAYRLSGPDEADLAALFNPAVHQPVSVARIVATDPDNYVEGTRLRSEEALHGLIAEALAATRDRIDVFHELAASPPKPPVWADRIDIMGTRAYPGSSSRAIHFDIVEAKKDPLSGTDATYDRAMSQVMKYVDFVAANYGGGNYASVSAQFVAADFSPRIASRHAQANVAAEGVVTRSYVLNPRDDPPTLTWSRLELVRYRWDQGSARLRLDVVG